MPSAHKLSEGDDLLVRFLKDQPPGPIENAAFKQFAKDTGHSWSYWWMEYTSHKAKFDELAGRSSSNASSNSVATQTIGRKHRRENEEVVSEPKPKRVRDQEPTSSTNAPPRVPSHNGANNVNRAAPTQTGIIAKNYFSARDVGNLTRFLRRQPAGDPSAWAWEILAKKHPRHDASEWRAEYLRDQSLYDDFSGRKQGSPSLATSTLVKTTTSPKKSRVENEVTAMGLAGPSQRHAGPLLVQPGNNATTESAYISERSKPAAGGPESKSKPKAQDTKHPFTMYDQGTLISFLKEQPPGRVTWEAFQALAARKPHHSAWAWQGKYYSDTPFYDAKSGRSSNPRLTPDVTQNTTGIRSYFISSKPDAISTLEPLQKRSKIDYSILADPLAPKRGRPSDSNVNSAALAATAMNAQTTKHTSAIPERVVFTGIPSILPSTQLEGVKEHQTADRLIRPSPQDKRIFSSASTKPADVASTYLDQIVTLPLKTSTPAQDILKVLGWIEVQPSNPTIALRMKRTMPAMTVHASKYMKISHQEVKSFKAELKSDASDKIPAKHASATR